MTPVILYTTAGMPIGARAIVQFYRPNVTTDTFGNSIAVVIPFGSEASGGTLLGSYVIEDLGLALAGTVVERSDTYGADADKAEVRKAPTLSLATQMASAGTPTLCPGDYCSINIGMQATSTGATPVPAPASRWFLDGDSVSQTQNQANKFALKLQLDRENSSPNLKEF